MLRMLLLIGVLVSVALPVFAEDPIEKNLRIQRSVEAAADDAKAAAAPVTAEPSDDAAKDDPSAAEKNSDADSDEDADDDSK